MRATHAHLVTKSNTIVEAAYRLTLQEQRLLLYCISQIDSRRPLEQQRTFVVEARPFRELFGIAQAKVYEEMREAVKRLFEREVRIVDFQNGQITRLRWVTLVKYHTHKGCAVLNFAPEMLPFLSDLKDRFTSYPLEAVAKLSSTFAMRLFELLSQYAKLGERSMAVEDMRRWLDCVDSYPRFSEFERWVIAPAVRQIDERSNLRVTYTKRQSGRTVTHVDFKITRAPDADKPVAKRSRGIPASAEASADHQALAIAEQQWRAHMRRLGYDPDALLAMARSVGPPSLPADD